MGQKYFEWFSQALSEHHEALSSLNEMQDEVAIVAGEMVSSMGKGGVIYWCGNGGSAADCQHYAAELMVRYKKNRKPIRSIALTTDTSLLTAHCNDIGFDSIFERQVQSLVSERDVVVGLSTSGNSENVFKALAAAKGQGAVTIALLGNDGGRIKEVADFSLVVKSKVTASVQECHLIIGHYLCRCLEEFAR